MSNELGTYNVRLVYERGHHPELVIGDGIVNHTKVDLTSIPNGVMMHAIFLEHGAPIAAERLPPSVCRYMYAYRNACSSMEHVMRIHCNIRCNEVEL